MAPEYDLQRFLEAQNSGAYPVALKELKEGRKKSHWMWFIFPQLQGLGLSPIARDYAINNTAEARAYLENEILGTRLRRLCEILLSLAESDPHVIFGSPDDLKLRSCMTLFDYIAPNDVFAKVLRKYYGGKADELTLSMLKTEKGKV